MGHPGSFRSRKYVKSNSHRKIWLGWILLLFSLLAYYSLSKQKDLDTYHSQSTELNDDTDFLGNVSDKVLSFGHGSVTSGGDSRYWDRDDRRRDHVKQSVKSLGGGSSSVGLYMESGRDELKLYEKEFEASLKNVGQSTEDEEEQIFDDEYDDAIDSNDARVAYPEEVDTGKGESIIKHPMGTKEAESDNVLNNVSNDTSTRTTDEVKTDSRNDNIIKGISAKTSISERETDSRRTPKRHKFAGSTCEIKFLNSTAQLVEPLESTKVSRFSLQYTDVEEKPSRQEQWEARFSGHQRLKEREESFYACDQKINCGFIKGPKGSPSTGFDLKEEDRRYMSSCRIAVSSCIFGNSDKLKSSFGKTVTHLSRKSVCFVMFVDESTLRTLSSKGQKPDKFGFVGLWKIVVVKSLPFADMRRVGKVPKFLAHRLFPSARYSIWLDSKLRLQVDPLIILEYFLWRNGYEYAISKHYSRRCVWEEVAQNKRLHKFNHTIIDQQFHFYQADGLKRYNASDPNKLLPSNVPEGSFIVRAHTPMSNLFSCLWFNEVDRFTPRDQLSFAYVYQKLRRMNPEKPFYFKMFKDCERRAIAKLFHHRSEGKRHIPSQANANA